MMNNNRRRNFRPRNHKNGFRRRNGHGSQSPSSSFQISGNRSYKRNGSSLNPQNLEKTIQKFQQLDKDAQSQGDPVLVENYLQHADHYSRRLKEISTKEKTFEKSSELNSSDSNIVEENQSESNTSKETIKE